MPDLQPARVIRSADAHAKANAEARARGECYDCGQPLTEPGAPGICAAGHTPESELEEATRLINGARQAAYSHPLDDYTCTGRLWGALLAHAGWTPPAEDSAVSPELACMMMVCVKLSREAHLHKRDNIVDGAGYFGCVGLIHDERARRG